MTKEQQKEVLYKLNRLRADIKQIDKEIPTDDPVAFRETVLFMLSIDDYDPYKGDNAVD